MGGLEGGGGRFVRSFDFARDGTLETVDCQRLKIRNLLYYYTTDARVSHLLGGRGPPPFPLENPPLIVSRGEIELHCSQDQSTRGFPKEVRWTNKDTLKSGNLRSTGPSFVLHQRVTLREGCHAQTFPPRGK